MTIATTTTFTVTRDDLIQAALRGLHLYGPTDTIPASDITYCAQALNIMVKAWAARGLMVWCVDNITLPTVNAQAAYQIGSTASGTGSLVTNRPIRIISAYTSIAGVSTGMTVESRFDYDTIDAPATAGTPKQLFYDPQVLNGEIYLYPVPNAVISVQLNVQRQVFDFNLSTDNPDFPQEFYQALKWGLMDEVAIEYEASQIATQLVSAKAEKYFKEAMQTQDADAKYARTTLSTTSVYGVNRDTIIQDALIEIGKYTPQDRIPATDITHCARQLNTMMKGWVSKGLMAWCVDDVVLPTVNAQSIYMVGDTATGGGSLVTPRPIRIISAYVVIAGVTTGLQVESRFDYDAIDVPATAGTPTTLFYDPQVGNGEVYLYPTPNAVVSVHLVVQRQVTAMNLSTDNPDFPEEFYQAAKWGLIDEIAIGYKATPEMVKMASEKSRMYFDEAVKVTSDIDVTYARTTLSTTSLFGVNRDSIIQDALIEIGKFKPSDHIPSTDVTHCARQLNTMVQAAINNGLLIWCINEVTLTTTNAVATYQIGPTATGTGAVVTPRPQKIISAYAVIAGVTTGLEVVSRFDYDTVDKQTTAGTPAQLFYDPQVTNGVVLLYPVPNSAVTIQLVVQRNVNVMNLATDNPDFPQEFYQWLKWGLIDEIALGYKAPPEVVKIASEKARSYLEEAAKISDVDAKYSRTLLSTDSTFGVNRDSIIQDALIEIGKYTPSDHIPATDITHCARQLNVMIKAWATKGMVIWCVNEVVLPLVATIATYPIGTTAGYIGAPVITTVGSGGTPGTYALTFTGGGGGTGFTGTYTIGAGGYLTAINITNGGTSCINPAPAISFPLGGITGAAGTVSVIGLSTNRPLRIMNAFIRDQYGNDTDLTVESRNDYNLLGNKTSPGIPNQLYYDPQLNAGLVTVYDVPMDALSSIHIIRQRQINEFNLATDNPDFPAEFYQALKWGLADEIALGYKSSPSVIQLCAVKAKAYLDEQMDFAQEDVSIFFQPRYQ